MALKPDGKGVCKGDTNFTISLSNSNSGFISKYNLRYFHGKDELCASRCKVKNK